jgi:hypothetical protein
MPLAPLFTLFSLILTIQFYYRCRYMPQFRPQFMTKHVVYHRRVSSIECDLSILIAAVNDSYLFFNLAVSLIRLRLTPGSAATWLYCLHDRLTF